MQRARQVWEQEKAEAEAEHSREAERLQKGLAELEAQQAEFHSERERWESQRTAAEQELAELRRQLERQASQLAGQREASESDRPARERENRPAEDLHPDRAGISSATGNEDSNGSVDEDRTLDALLSFRYQKTRWYRIKSALLRPFRRSSE